MPVSADSSALLGIFPKLAGEPIEYLGEGLDNTAYEVGKERVYLLPKNERSARRLGMLNRLLPEIQKEVDVAIPVFTEVAKNEMGEVTAVGYSKVPGQPLLASGVSRRKKDIEQALKDLAGFTSKLSQFPAQKAVQAGVKTTDHRRRAVEVFCKFARVAPAYMATSVIDFSEKAVGAYLEKPENFAQTPSLLHFDLHPNNTLFDKNCRLSGVIDFGCVQLGDAHYELATPWRCYGESNMREHFLPYYRNSPVEGVLPKMRLIAYLNLMNNFVNGVKHAKPTQIQRSREAIIERSRQNPADFSF